MPAPAAASERQGSPGYESGCSAAFIHLEREKRRKRCRCG
jgi:hypothetical protein